MSLAGLAKTRRSSKALVKAYEEAEDVHKEALMMRLEEERSKALASEPKPQQEPRESVIEQPEDEETQDDDKGPSPGQMTLF